MTFQESIRTCLAKYFLVRKLQRFVRVTELGCPRTSRGPILTPARPHRASPPLTK